jgi:hypothetical protein
MSWPTSSEDLLIRQAHRSLTRQRSGRGMVPQACVMLFFLTLGCWLVFRARLGPIPHGVTLGGGIIALLLALWWLPGLVTLSPLAPWGEAVPDNSCPRCGQPSLRREEELHFEPPGSGRPTLQGMVTLCTAGCGYAAAADVVVRSADGGLGSRQRQGG